MSEQKNNQKHVSIVIAGHVDSGKSTTTGRLIFELGGIDEREMQKLRDEAKTLNKESFAFAFYMDRCKEERSRGVTIQATVKEFHTDQYHYTIIDAPGHRDFIKNMLTGASQADVALLMVPADGNFTAAVAKGDHKAEVVQGQTRQHARLLNLLGVKQLIVGVNKMDCKTANYSQERYEECASEARNMLAKVGWKKEFIRDSVPIIPISGFKGDNLIAQSPNMPWWKGVDVKVGDEKVHVHTLLDTLNNMVQLPARKANAPMRMPVSSICKIRGVGDVITGRMEQGTVNPGVEVVFLPTHTKSNACEGRIFSIEMHRKSIPAATTGDNIGVNIRGLTKLNMPKTGDVMVLKSESGVGAVQSFTAQVQVLEHPGELKAGYTPIAYVRTGHSAVRMSKIDWKIGKTTGGQKVQDPPFVKANDMAQVVFEPQQPFVCDVFKSCEGLGRCAIMEGNGVVMLGKIVKVTLKE
jgi:elongation factor 1-alpha